MSDIDPAVSHTHTALTAEIVSAFVSNNPLPPSELPAFIAATHAALVGLMAPAMESTVEKATPAEIRKSITAAGLVSFIDGRRYKTLKRHIGTHGFTPESYRKQYGLPADYPMIATNYSEARSTLAKGFGLGRKRSAETPTSDSAVEVAEGDPEAPKRRGRAPKVKAEA